MSRRALQAAASAGARQERLGEHGWLEWLRARLDPALAPWRVGRRALLFTGDLAATRTAAWPCRTPGCPTATRRPSGRCDGCRRARLAAGLAGRSSTPRRRRARPGRWPGRLPGARLRRRSALRRACVSGTNVPGARTGPSRSRRSSPGPARWPGPPGAGSPAATGRASAAAGCAGSTTTGCAASTRRLAVRRTSWPPGSPASGRGSGCTSSPWPGCPSCCAPSSSYALQQRDQAPPPLDPTQVRILLARLGGARLAARRRPAGRLRVRRRAVQLRDPRPVPRPATAPGPGLGGAHRRRPVRRRRVAGGAAGPAAQRLPALARHPGRDRLPPHRAGLAARDRQGLGPLHPPLPAAAAGDAARLPGRLARPGHRRPRRPGQPRRR